MNPEVKQHWIEALQSGQYQQGFKLLRTDKNSFCCLGVLCELHRKEHKKRWGVNGLKQYSYMGTAVALPKEVLKWAELDLNYKFVLIQDDVYNSLANINDEGKSFEEIAKIIEEHL